MPMDAATTTVPAAASFIDWVIVIPPVVGALSGFQAIYDKFPANSLRAIAKPGAIGYMITRIAAPLLGYSWWFHHQATLHHSLLAAFGWGFGTEVVLRSKFYFGQSKTTEGAPEPNFKGGFDLLEWYQKLWLNHVGNQLATARNDFVTKLIGTHSNFPTIAGSARKQANGWPQDQKKLILEKILESEAAFAAAGANPNHQDYISGLAFALLDLVGEKGVAELFPKQPGATP